jgi:hypothetical protein
VPRHRIGGGGDDDDDDDDDAGGCSLNGLPTESVNPRRGCVLLAALETSLRALKIACQECH